MNVTGPLRRLARTAPHSIAIIGPDGATLSFAALDARIDQLARQALRHGMRAGQTAALTITDPHDLPGLLLALALARIGVAIAPHSLPGQHLHWRFARPEAPYAGDIHALPAWFADAPAGEPPAIAPDQDSVFAVFASSGTTGSPRHVPVTHRQMAARVLHRALCDGATPLRRMVLTAPGGAWGMSIILRTLWYAGTLVMSPPHALADNLTRHRVGALTASPHSLRTLLDQGAPNIPVLAIPDLAIETGGSGLPPALAGAVATRLSPNIWTSLASSEAGGIASAPLSATAHIAGAAGWVWPGTELRITTPEGQPLPTGAEGQIRLRGPMLASFYLGDAAASAASFIDGWHLSGDLGTLDPDGMLVLTGRQSDLINLGGDKIAPGLIERVLLRLPGVSEAAAFGIEDDDGIEQIWAAIVAAEPIDEESINQICSTELGHLAPSTLLQFRTLPRTPAGKLDRAQLIAYARDLNQGLTPAD